ncbi:MAG: hypothetical protein JOS17DRAFT_733659 [Linnemannia elongata]|nr:MAG: hypothetical protein JOS17DRAFT_733659 [Linnemannia elongata]
MLIQYPHPPSRGLPLYSSSLRRAIFVCPIVLTLSQLLLLTLHMSIISYSHCLQARKNASHFFFFPFRVVVFVCSFFLPHVCLYVPLHATTPRLLCNEQSLIASSTSSKHASHTRTTLLHTPLFFPPLHGLHVCIKKQTIEAIEGKNKP